MRVSVFALMVVVAILPARADTAKRLEFENHSKTNRHVITPAQKKESPWLVQIVNKFPTAWMQSDALRNQRCLSCSFKIAPDGSIYGIDSKSDAFADVVKQMAPFDTGHNPLFETNEVRIIIYLDKSPEYTLMQKLLPKKKTGT
jgi:hypothetical protein